MSVEVVSTLETTCLLCDFEWPEMDELGWTGTHHAIWTIEETMMFAELPKNHVPMCTVSSTSFPGLIRWINNSKWWDEDGGTSRLGKILPQHQGTTPLQCVNLFETSTTSPSLYFHLSEELSPFKQTLLLTLNELRALERQSGKLRISIIPAKAGCFS